MEEIGWSCVDERGCLRVDERIWYVWRREDGHVWRRTVKLHAEGQRKAEKTWKT